MFARRRGPSYDPNDELDEPTTSRPSLAGIPMLESAGNGDEAAQEKGRKNLFCANKRAEDKGVDVNEDEIVRG